MQFSTLALFAASASAAALAPRLLNPEKISDFRASCKPGTNYCEYAFGVTNDRIKVAPNQCFACVPGSETLPEVVTHDACKVPSTDTINWAYSWSIAKSPDGGLSFEFWWPFDSRTNLTYCHDISPKELVMDTQGDVKTQRYIGPTDFEMPFCPFKHH